MVLAAAALLLCAPYLWDRTHAVPLLVPIAIPRRHLQQPSVEPQPPGDHACRSTSSSGWRLEAYRKLFSTLCHTMSSEVADCSANALSKRGE
jgi:hypothetical protein